MIRAIIFDFFDVLRTDGSTRWLKKHGLDRDGAFLGISQKHDRGEYSDTDFFQELGQLTHETAEEVEREMEDGNELNEPLVEYIRTLQDTYKLAILSNSSSDYLRNEIAKYDLAKYFDEIVISSEVGLIKPEPEIFNLIMHKLAMQPEECIFTDDNPKHVAAAETLGVHGVVYRSVPELKQHIAKVVADAVPRWV